MATRPPGLIYGLEDRPPPAALGLLAIQHIFLMSSTLVLPVVLVAEIGGTAATVGAVVSLTMIACGIGTILQGLRLPFLGSGFLCPNLAGPNFFAASISAAWLGGLPLMRGMTIAAGLIEILFARVIHRIAFLFPAEVTGLVVLMVAVSLIPVGTSKFLHIDYGGEPIDPVSLAVATVTLFIMVGLNVWGSARMRLYGVLIGMATGYVLSLATGLLTAADFAALDDAAWIGLPTFDGMFDIAFEWTLLPAFAIVAICGALKSFGNLVMCEKINDAEWKEPDMKRVGNGLVADGVCVTLSGLLGGMASDTSSSNVALSGASGASARIIGYAAGGLFIALGFSPKIGAVLTVMPAAVAGAIVVFVICFMVASGLSIIMATKPDVRRTFVIGIALCFGLSLDILPGLYAQVPSWSHPLFDSSLTLATVIAVVLTQLLRFGDREAAHGHLKAPPPPE